MQIKKIMKWLPVALSLLGALGYTGYGSEAVRTAVAVLDVLGAAGDAGSDAPARRRASAKSGHRYTGTVSKVYDGDTLHVIDGDGAKHKIRMAYIDAPEMKQAYGTRSRDNLRAAAEGRKVSVRVFDTDRYQREVAQVSVGKTDLNLMQVQDGRRGIIKVMLKNSRIRRILPIMPTLKFRRKGNAKDCGKLKIRKRRGRTAGQAGAAGTIRIGWMPWANGWAFGKDTARL